MCSFEKKHFLTWIDLNPGFGRNRDTFLKKYTSTSNEDIWTRKFSNSMQGIVDHPG